MSLSSFVNKIWHAAAARFRSRRRRRFLSIFPTETIRSIIDVGGLVEYWEEDIRSVTVLNVMGQSSKHCAVVVGDGRQTAFSDKSFDLAYSNSVIEHVGKWQDQVALARELQRIGSAVYCQTPNRWFPVEVHYLTLFVHWYPRLLRNYLVARFLTGWGWLVRPTHEQVRKYADSICLLTFRQMRRLFPDCVIEREKFLGMTKSLIAIRKS